MPDAAGRDIGRMRVGRPRVTVDEINRRGMPQTGGISAYRVELLRPLSHPLPPFELLPLPAEAVRKGEGRGRQCPLHVDTRLSLAGLAGYATQFAPHRRSGPSLRFRRPKGSSQV